MSLSLFTSLVHRITSRRPLLLYAALWMAVLTVAVAIASFSPEMAFVVAISPSSSFSRPCDADTFVRVPIDLPSEVFCVPAHLFQRSKMDLIVPPVFAAVVVAASACVVRAFGL
ncbi:hypothetical protein Nepgr_011998 [Nepenthes gracilis]|uniref:Uncharacterized protein n=1 Tax=Nepenthes gracilis TaxID=150966 RepID=A0AAD3SGJ5_NEPGR|nr:hypothetical protein Nepgr_011998 [Nepenthes gracilis]